MCNSLIYKDYVLLELGVFRVSMYAFCNVGRELASDKCAKIAINGLFFGGDYSNCWHFKLRIYTLLKVT